MPAEIEPLLYDAEQAMRLLSLNRRQLYRLVGRGVLKKHPSFRALVFRKRDLDDFVNKS